MLGFVWQSSFHSANPGGADERRWASRLTSPWWASEDYTKLTFIWQASCQELRAGAKNAGDSRKPKEWPDGCFNRHARSTGPKRLERCSTASTVSGRELRVVQRRSRIWRASRGRVERTVQPSSDSATCRPRGDEPAAVRHVHASPIMPRPPSPAARKCVWAASRHRISR